MDGHVGQLTTRSRLTYLNKSKTVFQKNKLLTGVVVLCSGWIQTLCPERPSQQLAVLHLSCRRQNHRHLQDTCN